MRARLLALLLVVSAAGCGDDDPAEVDGFPYSADLRVLRYTDRRADLYACFYRYHWCEEAGAVQVEQGVRSIQLSKNFTPDATWYAGSLEDTRVDEPFVFTWSGAGDQADATAEVGVAEMVRITSPASGSSLSTADPVTMEWQAGAGDDLIAWGYRAYCPDSSSPLESFSHLVPDSGHLEMPGEQVSFYDGCSVELWLERLRRGSSSARNAVIVSSQATFVQVSIEP
jgi:hypothetical protein